MEVMGSIESHLGQYVSGEPWVLQQWGFLGVKFPPQWEQAGTHCMCSHDVSDLSSMRLHG